MSDKPISVNDVVIIVSPDCEGSRGYVLGRIGRVESIGVLPSDKRPFCDCCMRQYPVSQLTKVGDIYPPLSWLKRLDPGNVSEDVPTGEEITA